MQLDRRFVFLLLLLLAVSLVAMALLPFADTSEPRYAEIARVMAVSGDWITPWFQPGVPFWGKPPLSFWAQALSIKWLGVHEFAVRFPSWLSMLAILWIMYRLVTTWFDVGTAKRALLIYASMALVFIASGAVLTDPYLALGAALATAGVVMSAHDRSWFWRYAFFIGLSIGLLAKGPLVIVLVGGALFPWFVLSSSARACVKGLPWVTGILLVIVLVLPWYVAAELKTPGFLNYFLLGEHVGRFLDPGWAGDRYGTAHKETYGTIWYYWLQAAFPWCLYAIVLLAGGLMFKTRRQALFASLRDDRIIYLLGWSLFTLAFFTFSGNILWTYVLPALPGWSVLLAVAMGRGAGGTSQANQRALWLALVAPVTVSALVFWAMSNPGSLKTEKWLVQYVESHAAPDQPLYYLDDLPFSARYYSRETAIKLDMPQLTAKLAGTGTFWLAIPKGHPPIPGLDKVATQVFDSKFFILMRVVLSSESAPSDQGLMSPDARPRVE